MDALVEEEDDRSEGGFILEAIRFNLLIGYSDPLWAGLGTTLAALCSGHWCVSWGLAECSRSLPLGLGAAFRDL